MLDAIHIASSGLTGHQQGLKVISNNVSNMNTAGFKASRVNFSDVYTSGHHTANDGAAENPLGGAGLDAQTATLDLTQGRLETTSNDMNLAIDGPGFFVIRTPDGKQLYTKSGDFELNAQGHLVLRGTENRVLARSTGGGLEPVQVNPMALNPQKPTSSITLDGNLSSDGTSHTHTIDNIKVYDALGTERILKAVFTRSGSAPQWQVVVTEGTTQVGTGQFNFQAGIKAPGWQPVNVMLITPGAASTQIAIDLTATSGSISGGTVSTLKFKEQDGYAPGRITKVAFDDKGLLKISFSNAQTSTGQTIAIAEIRSADLLSPLGSSLFDYAGAGAPPIRQAGGDIKLLLRQIELSNVQLEDQFSALILMQRGYQASSQVLTTANEMLQQLFQMSGRR